MPKPSSPNTPEPGLLILVAGPSGAGKDTLIDHARLELGGRRDFVFPAREITRASDAGGEDHRAVTAEDFARRAAMGAYALHWRAHGLGYGIPASIRGDLGAGKRVVVNVSRGVVATAQARFSRMRVVYVTAPESVLAARIAARGRESADEAERRLSREAGPPETGDVTIIVNDGALDAAQAAFLAAVTA
jgi:ribose 1,5-bisphosphokinase